MKDVLSPKELAAAIGVSESSLRRWVDSGVLKFSRTVGGHRRIPLAEAVRFIRDSHATVVRPDLLGLPPLSTTLDSHTDSDRLHDALLAGDSSRARGIVLSMYLIGSPIPSLLDGPLTHSLHRIGSLYQHSPKGILIEHRATDIAIQIVSHLRQLLATTSPRPQLGTGNRELGTSTSPRSPVLSLRDFSRPPALKDVSLDLHQGEVLGIAGLMGSGRTELLRSIFAADPHASGQLLLNDAPVHLRSPADAVRHGIAFLTEDRKSQGLLLPSSIQSNTTLTHLPSISPLRTLLSPRRERANAEHYISTLSTRCRSPRQSVRELSGGNQQKVVLAKWLFRDSSILLLDEPTRGIDVGAKFEIYSLLQSLAAAGKSLIVVSSDLLELMLISHRIAVMSNGKLVQTFTKDEWTQESIMQAALSGYSSS
jgi:excisionase family DNA binding protein